MHLGSLAGFHVRWSKAGEETIGLLEGLDSRVLEELPGHVDGIVSIYTCNRFEVYIDSRYPERARRLLEELLPPAARGSLEETRGKETIRHLMRVASGLDSAILGEHEVLGQVRDAWLRSKRMGLTTWLLDQAFHRAIVAGRRARSETGIARGRVGYPEVAVDIAAMKLGTLDGASIGVVGAGSAGRGIMVALCSSYKPGSVTVYNRSPERALEAARLCGARVASLSDLAYASHDVVFVAVTGYRVPREAVSRAKLVVDISNPPAASGGNVVGFNEVTRLARERMEERRKWIPLVEDIIEEELGILEMLIARSAGDMAASVVMRYAHSLVEAEVEATLRSLRRGGDERRSLETAFESYARKLMHPLLSALRKASLEGRQDLVEIVAMEYARRVGRDGEAEEAQVRQGG